MDKTKKQRNIEIAVLLALVCAIFLSFAGFDASCDNLRGSVLRLHIIANSDSAEDQALKLKVRDAILENSDVTFKDCTDLDTAIICAKDSIDEITEIANSVIKQNGFSYTAHVGVGESYFDTREYEDFTLPAGTYKSLIVKLGNAQGKNWWCVVFPAVCIPAASDASLSDSASQKSAEIAENPKQYVMRFKAVELYEDLKQKFLKRKK